MNAEVSMLGRNLTLAQLALNASEFLLLGHEAVNRVAGSDDIFGVGRKQVQISTQAQIYRRTQKPSQTILTSGTYRRAFNVYVPFNNVLK